MFIRQRWVWGTVVTLAALTLWLVTADADVQIGRDFQANDLVESIRVEITVADGGEDLDEPIALDLGLGFPLWLHRLGRVDGADAPFGAVPQRGTEAHAIRAGERATFEFLTSGAAGSDDLRTTPQLLAGVHVSDISRVGFTSKGDHGWIIAGYAIQINGKPFVANNTVNVNGRGVQDAARERLAELNRDLAPQQTELTDLEALVAAGLATDADRLRLADLEVTLAPQRAEQRRLQRQLSAAAPLFTESGFRSTWRTNGAIEKVKVTVVTAPHTGAQTSNFVYFRTGGHKYLLSSPLNPLSPDFGPQEFELDLAMAPLTAGDLRGFALGMLAHHQPYGDAPDRWHPQRLRVEVDDRIVYDSEESTIDRASLAAIRVIPPAHVNSNDQVVENAPIARETSVWESGSAAGLDLARGGPMELPTTEDPACPDPEPGLVIDPDVAIIEEGWYDPECGPFPGEMGFGPGWEPGWGPGSEAGWEPGWGPGWTGPGWLDLLAYGLLDELGLLPDWVIPDPVGEPPQLEQVEIDYATNTIHWTVAGNADQIDHFLVDRVLIRPDLDVPLVEVVGEPYEVGGDQRSLLASELEPVMLAGTFDESSRSYLAFRVTLVPTDPAIGVDPGLAPARPLRETPHWIDLNLALHYDYTPAGGAMVHPEVSPTGRPELPGAAVWPAGQISSHTGLVFAGMSQAQHHIVARPDNNGDEFEVRFNVGALPQGQYRLIAFAGFEGGVEHPVEADVTSTLDVRSILFPLQHAGDMETVHIAADPALPPTHLIPLVHDFDTAVVAAGPMILDLRYHFTNITVDPQHPPTLFGVRLIPH